MDPSSSDPSYLKATNAAIYSAMVSAGFTNATFVMQGWLFVNSPDFWTPSNVQAFLSGVPDDRMLVSAVSPVGRAPGRSFAGTW